MLIDFSARALTTVDFPALNGPVTRIRGKYTVSPTRSLNVYGIQFVRIPFDSICEMRIELRMIPPRRDDWNSTTKSDIERISSSSRSIRVQLMNRKQMTVPADRAASISSRQSRRTFSLGNRSMRNSIESTTMRPGCSAAIAATIASRMFARLSMSSMWYFSWLGRRSWDDVASTRTSFAGSMDPNRFSSPRASCGARKKSTYRQVSPALAHLDDAVDEGPQEVHRHRLVDALVDRVQDEAQVRFRSRRDDLEELGDRLRRIVEEQGRHGVEVNADGRPDLLARLAHRHPDPLEVAEARDEERLLSGGRLRRSLRRGRAVAVDEHERLGLDRIQVEVQRLRPRSDLAR